MQTNNNIVPFSPSPASLVDIRMDSRKYPRIKNLDQPTAVHDLAAVVAMAFSYTGREYTLESVLGIASALYTEIVVDEFGLGTGNITIEEIGRAVRRAVLGEREMYGINVSSLYKVICDYAEGEGHAAQVAANNRHKKQTQQTLAAHPAGAMLTAYTGALLKSTTLKSSEK